MIPPLSAMPQALVEVDGAPLSADDESVLAEVRVQQRLSAPTLCELTFRDPPAAGLAAALLPGATLRVQVRGQSPALFVGQVTAVDHIYGPAHEHEVRVRGYDLLHQLRKRQPVRAHVQVTLRELAKELVADLGLSVQMDQSGPQWQTLIQHRQSDLELLIELAERCGLFLTLRGDDLHILTLEGIGDPQRLILGEGLHEARIEINGDLACRTVNAAGWNPLRVETHTGRASASRSGRSVDAEVSPQRVGGTGERDFANESALDDQHADALAQAELDIRAAREVTLWGVADGDPSLQPGTPIDVRGVADALIGRYVLTAVTHTINSRLGFISELSTLPSVPHERARSAVVAVGIVSRVDDPQNLGRIRVSLPTYGEVETDWMHVLSAGAGSNKGLMILPDVGDHVLLLFAHEDPGEGVVLGGLYGMPGMPDSGVESNSVRRYTLLTPGGQRICLDDARRVIHVEDSSGSYLDLAPGKVKVHAAADLDIEAPGRSVTIRGMKIDFERG
jgi:phage baseplate assembly protein gpV/phage protein D